jgi:hypothetical protein
LAWDVAAAVLSAFPAWNLDDRRGLGGGNTSKHAAARDRELARLML